MICSFDFDHTLSEPCVQQYAKELIKRGIKVAIVTQRPPAMHKEVFKVACELKIELNNIHFCGNIPKEEVLEEMDYEFHLDDKVLDVPRFVLFDENFRINCEKMIRDESK